MRKILLSFSSQSAIESLSLVLRPIGAQLNVAQSPEAMVDALLGDSYSLLLTNHISPFLGGGDLVGRLCRRPVPRPSIFIISHLRHEPTLLALYESGVDQFISFPLSPHRLLRKVVEELQTRP
ncbi:MAG: hypothetical protein J6V31_00025 [Tidjanibacter sp.]|nr:hypothetical protein [Tidjanibacter sp.]